jgi:hypothetical protein
LIKQHHPPAAGIKVPAVERLDPTPWPPVQKHHWLALWVAALLVVEGVQGRDGQKALVVGLDGRVKLALHRRDTC